MTRRQLGSILGGEILLGSLVVEWWKSLMDHSPKARNMIFKKGVDNGQLPSYMGIKISHDMRILDWRSRTFGCVCFSTLLSSSMIPSQIGVMAIFWALMRTSSLMNFFQTQWDLNRWINWVPRYRGHGSMLCRGFQKSSKLFFLWNHPCCSCWDEQKIMNCGHPWATSMGSRVSNHRLTSFSIGAIGCELERQPPLGSQDASSNGDRIVTTQCRMKKTWRLSQGNFQHC